MPLDTADERSLIRSGIRRPADHRLGHPRDATAPASNTAHASLAIAATRTAKQVLHRGELTRTRSPPLLAQVTSAGAPSPHHCRGRQRKSVRARPRGSVRRRATDGATAASACCATGAATTRAQTSLERAVSEPEAMRRPGQAQR
jgi:hypothetical protein